MKGQTMKLSKFFLAAALGLVISGAVLASAGYFTTKQFTLTVAPTLIISTNGTLPSAVAGQPYSLTFAATGGIGSYTWTVTSGSTLPAGLTLSSSGTLSGTPSTAGNYTFTITCTDGAGNQSYVTIRNK